MVELHLITAAIGLAAFAGGSVAVLAPGRMRSALESFPRSVWPGRVLAALALSWAAWEVSQMHLGRFDAWKPHLLWLTPVAIVLCSLYVDELLAPRALGGLLLLLSRPLLDAVRWHPSDLRLVMSVLGYLWIAAGLVLLLAPWWFRRIARVVARDDCTIRRTGLCKAAAGIALLVLSFFI